MRKRSCYLILERIVFPCFLDFQDNSILLRYATEPVITTYRRRGSLHFSQLATLSRKRKGELTISINYDSIDRITYSQIDLNNEKRKKLRELFPEEVTKIYDTRITWGDKDVRLLITPHLLRRLLRKLKELKG
jgi:hypothetical protein